MEKRTDLVISSFRVVLLKHDPVLDLYSEMDLGLQHLLSGCDFKLKFVGGVAV